MTRPRLEVVLDKSYLQGASAAAIQNLCRSFRVIMPGALFFELMTTSDLDARRCSFAKFPDVMNPVEIVEHVGILMQFEIRNSKPSTPLYERRHKWLFKFNETLAAGTFQPTQKQLQGISSWQQQIEEQVEVFRQTVATTHLTFPQISEASNRERPGVIEEIKRRIASDAKLVRSLYGKIRLRSYPRKDKLDGRWAFFRWTQVDFLASLDHIARYGVGSDLSSVRKLDNEVADLQYRIMGVLAGAFATRDKKCKEVFRLLRPDGLLIC